MTSKEPFVCKECSSGVHKHMVPMSSPDFKNLDLHEQLGSIDCKNVSPDGNSQCVCLEWREFYNKKMDEIERGGQMLCSKCRAKAIPLGNKGWGCPECGNIDDYKEGSR